MPSDALAIAPVILAVVLVVSAVGKLQSPRRSAEAFRDLRVPAPFNSKPAVEALPWGEILLALLLLVASGWLGVVAAVAAVLLFAAYLLLVVRALGFDVPVDCACFGEFAPGQIGRRTVVRNGWLVALAVLGLVGSFGGDSLLGRVVDGTAPWWWLAAAGAAAVTTFLVTAPARGDAARSASSSTGADDDPAEQGDYVRAITPALPVVLGDGTETDLRQLSASRAQLLLFVSEGCSPCVEVIEATPRWREQLPQLDVRHVVAVDPGVGTLTAQDEPRSLHDPLYRLPASFGFRGTPSAVVLGADGLLAGGPVTGDVEVAAFVTDIAEQLGASTLD
ncbi:TlpA family protein disulfide reductase [Monashia sp. NPDC004114]